MSSFDARDRSRLSSSTMIRGVRSGDPEAWNRLFDVWGPVIYAWCRKRDVNRTDAADIVQEVLLRVFQKIGEFEHRTFQGWVWRITYRSIINHFRDRKRHPRPRGGSSAIPPVVDLPDPDGIDAEESPGRDSSFVVRQVLKVIRNDFEERTFQACWRTTVDGLSSAKVANELGMTVVGVRQAKCRVLKRLREELEEML